MSAYFYQLTMAVLIVAFLVARAPFLIKYRKTYKTRRSLSRKLTIDKALVGLNSIAWVLVPLLWSFGIITVGVFYLPDSIRIAGILLYIAGLMVMWVSHYHLSENWSAIVEVRESHELIKSGIYKHIRHPMYTDFYMQVFALPLISSNIIVGLLAIGSWQALYMHRIDKEEAFLVSEFGEKYLKYRASTGRLFPKIKA